MNREFKKGKSGIKYEFGIFKFDEEIPDKPGVYFLVSESQPILSGVTNNMRDEVVKLRKECSVENSLIYLHIRYDEVLCSLIEQDLIQKNEHQGANRTERLQFVS